MPSKACEGRSNHHAVSHQIIEQYGSMRIVYEEQRSLLIIEEISFVAHPQCHHR